MSLNRHLFEGRTCPVCPSIGEASAGTAAFRAIGNFCGYCRFNYVCHLIHYVCHLIRGYCAQCSFTGTAALRAIGNFWAYSFQ